MNKSGALQRAPLLLSKKVLPFRDRKNILILNDKYIPVYNAYSGQTETMQAKWANLKKMEEETFATVYKGNIIKNLIMDCQSYTKYRPNETTGGIFVSWRRKEELPTGA